MLVRLRKSIVCFELNLTLLMVEVMRGIFEVISAFRSSPLNDAASQVWDIQVSHQLQAKDNKKITP
jgi:hypothetical protein